VSVHLVKLCVGVESVRELADWQRLHLAECRAAGLKAELVHVTRQTPKRAAEIVKDGSIFWVIKGAVVVRQRVIALRPTIRDDHPACAIVCNPQLVRTVPFPRAPFQGWRYLRPQDAPPDIAAVGGDLPVDLKIELAKLGLL
jgi:hypothetical protein